MEKERSQKRVKPEKRSKLKKEIKSLKRSDLKKGMKPSKRIELKKLVKSSKRTKRVTRSEGRKLKKRATPPKGSRLKEVKTLKQKLIGSLENEKKDQTVTNVSVVENTKEEAEVFQAFNDVTMSVNYEEATKFLPKPEESRLYCPGIRDMKSLYTAAATGQVKCVQKLINTGVNFNFYNEYGWTALHCAVVTGDHLCLKTLLKAGANCSVRAGRPVSKVDVDLNFANETPLHVAARYDCVTCAKELIEFGADYDTVNSKGYTSLHIAAEVGSKQFILFLLQNSHGLFSLSSTSFDDSIPLHYAIDSRSHGMVECVKEMVRLGSNVNHPNRYGVTPLHILLATYTNDGIDLEILKCFILEGSADIDSIIEKSYTPLDLAIARRNLQLVDLLVACGADVNFKNLLYPSSIDYGLFAKWGLDILNYIVTHVPRLPRLKSVLDPLDENLHSELRLASYKTGLCIEVTGLEEVKIIEEKLGSNVIINLPESMQYPLQQPFLDVIYERIIKKLDDIKRDFDSVTDIWDLNPEKRRERTHLFVLERQLWYERIACNPLTLKDCCRISIRKCVGLHVEEIRKLPLPECLRSYLLLQPKE